MFFDKCDTIDQVKDRYRILSKRFHPDLGGSHELMKELNEEYEIKLKNPNSNVNLDDILQNWRNRKTSPYKKKDKYNTIQLSSQEKIDLILSWAKTHHWFDTEFVESLQEKLDLNGDLTYRQEESLNNIITKFKIQG